MVVTQRRKSKKKVSMADSVVQSKNRGSNNHQSGSKKCSDIIQIICNHFDAFQKLQEDSSPLSGNKQKVKVAVVSDASDEKNVAKKYGIMLRDELATIKVISDFNKVQLEHEEEEKCQHDVTSMQHQQNMIIVRALFHVIYANLNCSIKDGKVTKKSVDCYDYARDQSWNLLVSFLHVLGEEEISQCITEKLIQLSHCIKIEDIRGQCVVALGHLSLAHTSVDTLSVFEALVTRLQDKNQTVRLLAVQACGQWYQNYFQKNIKKSTNVDNDDDVMMDQLLHIMERDSSPAIRQAVISTLKCVSSPDPKVLTCVMRRVHDTKVKVRVEALNFLKVHSREVMEKMSSEECSLILKYGLTERCAQTFEATSKMLCCGWLKVMKFDPLKLLSRLEPTYNEEICEEVARVIVNVTENKHILNELSKPEIQAFKEEVLNVKHFDKMWKFSSEQAQLNLNTVDSGIDVTNILFLRIRCQSLQKMEEKKTTETQLSKILPDMPDICNALNLHLNKLNNAVPEESDNLDSENSSVQDIESYICLQILQLVELCDLKEEGSRRHLASLLQSVMVMLNTPDDVLQKCVLILLATHSTEAQFIQTISEVLADINDLKSNHDDRSNVENENHLKSQENALNLAKMIRTIAIISIVLENISSRMSTNTILKTLASTYIEPAITHSDAMVREAGVSCLGKFTIMMMQDSAILNETKSILLNVGSNVKERMETRAQAVLALTDLSMMHDSVLSPITLKVSSAENEENNNEDEKTEYSRGRKRRNRRKECPVETELEVEKPICLVSILQDMLRQSRHPALCVIAAECSAKLMFAGKVHDSISLAYLIVMYFNDDFNSDDDEVGDCATDIGSPVRLQQLLTLFFPAYCMRFKLGRVAMMSSIKHMLELIHTKMSKRVRGRRAFAWPIVKMIEYVCNNVEEGEEQFANRDRNSQENPTDDNVEKEIMEEEDQVDDLEPSPILLLAIAIAEFLVENGSDLPVRFLRILCKVLNGIDLDLESESIQHLNLLTTKMDELSLVITDSSSLRSLESMFEVLSEIPNLESDMNGDEMKRDSIDSAKTELSGSTKSSCASVVSAFQSTTLDGETIHGSKKDDYVHDSTTKQRKDSMEDDFFEGTQDSSLLQSEENKENPFYHVLSKTFTPMKKKSKSIPNLEKDTSSPSALNKRKNCTPVKSATKPRATKKGLYNHNQVI